MVTHVAKLNRDIFIELLKYQLDAFLVLCDELTTGADPGFDQGGAQIVTGLNCRWCAAASCERSEPFSAWGPGPALGP